MRFSLQDFMPASKRSSGAPSHLNSRSLSNHTLVNDPVTVRPVLGEDTLDGIISGIDSGVVRITLAKPLPEGEIVNVTAGENYSTIGRVLYCVRRNGSHDATIGLQQAERRVEARIPAAATARVTSMEMPIPLDCEAQVVDVSKSGIGLLIDRSLPRDLLLKIVLDSAIVFAEVRHCSPRPSSNLFHVGVEIQSVILRNEDHSSNLRVSPRSLWAQLTEEFQNLAFRMKRQNRANETPPAERNSS